MKFYKPQKNSEKVKKSFERDSALGLIESHAANKAISISSVKGNLQSQGEKCPLEKSLSRKNLGVIIAHNRSGTDKCNPRTSKSLT